MQLKNGIFVTGTDTEVGKTIVARAIVRALVRKGVGVAVLKPVESGAPEVDGRLVPEDASALLAAGRSDVGLQDVCPFSFPDPVSPHLAAGRVGAVIDPELIIDLMNRRAADSDLLVAEGAGGFMVPLSEDLLYCDLMARSGCKLLIVSPNVLGTINATLLTIEAARSRGIEVLGVVLNKTPSVSLGNAEAIAKYGKVSILGEFPSAPGDASDDQLADLAEKHLDLGRVF